MAVPAKSALKQIKPVRLVEPITGRNRICRNTKSVTSVCGHHSEVHYAQHKRRLLHLRQNSLAGIAASLLDVFLPRR